MIAPPLHRRDPGLTERMDDPHCDRTMLERTYARFRPVNALVTGWRATYRRHLRPLLSRDRVTTVLDIGSGGGDIPRRLLRWARRDGFALHITALDPDPRAHAWAMSRPPVPGLTHRRALSGELIAENRSFDLVISNHLLHHLDPGQLKELLADSRQLARRRVVHSDIRRSRWGYLLFSAVTGALLPLLHGSFIREDGLLSIRRSYTPSELRDLAPRSWCAAAQFPSRSLLIHDAPASGAAAPPAPSAPS